MPRAGFFAMRNKRSQALLQALGYEPAQIASLRARGIVGGPG